MTKRLSAKNKISRKLGVALWGQSKDPFLKRNYKPGQHGSSSRTRPTDYGTQLKAKQKLKFYYGNISEKQFRNLFKGALKIKGDVSENFIGLLETRLDTVVYRSNLVPTVFAARQFINHKHIKVNGSIVNIPSYRLKPGDVIEVRDKSKDLNILLESLQKMERDVPDYIELNSDNKSAKYINVPNLADVPYPTQMEPNLVVEFYSR